MANPIHVVVTPEEIFRWKDAAPDVPLLSREEFALWRVRDKLIAAGIPLLSVIDPSFLRVSTGCFEWGHDCLNKVTNYRWTPPTTPGAA